MQDYFQIHKRIVIWEIILLAFWGAILRVHAKVKTQGG